MNCKQCGGPLPEDAPKRAKYCGATCRNKFFNSRQRYEDKKSTADESTDWFGFLTREGLANSDLLAQA